MQTMNPIGIKIMKWYLKLSCLRICKQQQYWYKFYLFEWVFVLMLYSFTTCSSVRKLSWDLAHWHALSNWISGSAVSIFLSKVLVCENCQYLTAVSTNILVSTAAYLFGNQPQVLWRLEVKGGLNGGHFSVDSLRPGWFRYVFINWDIIGLGCSFALVWGQGITWTSDD